MKVRISYTVDMDDDIRRSINAHYGDPGLATRERVKAWFESNGVSSIDDLAYDAQLREEADEADEDFPDA